MKSQALCTVFAALLLAGCSQSATKASDQASDNLTTQPAITKDSNRAPGKLTAQPAIIITGSEGGSTFPADPANITSMTIVGDTLRLTITHGGGCADHTYQLHTSGIALESHPPQMSIYLAHDANDDMCEALLTKDLAFDLSPLKQHFGGSTSTVMLRVHEPGAAAAKGQVLRYQY